MGVLSPVPPPVPKTGGGGKGDGDGTLGPSRTRLGASGGPRSSWGPAALGAPRGPLEFMREPWGLPEASGGSPGGPRISVPLQPQRGPPGWLVPRSSGGPQRPRGGCVREKAPGPPEGPRKVPRCMGVRGIFLRESGGQQKVFEKHWLAVLYALLLR